MAPTSQPFRIELPLNAEQAQNIDSMFQILFDDLRNGATALTPGSVVFVGSTGYLSQNNAKLFWDNTNLNLQLGGRLSFTGTTLRIDKITTRFLHDYTDPTSDGNNTFLGFGAGNFTMSPGGGASTLASRNTGIGYGALPLLTTGSYNVALGANALNKTTTGIGNIGIGSDALTNLLTARDNVAIGWDSCHSLTTGIHNVAIGTDTLFTNNADNNIAIGINALYAASSGGNNAAIGVNALNLNQTGVYNIAIGTDAVASAVGASYNIGIGSASLTKTTGGSNLALGFTAMHENTTGVKNVAIGWQALFSNNGDSNVILGYNAGLNQTAVSNKLIIDNQDRTSVALELTEALIVGTFNAASASQTLRFNAAVSVGGTAAGVLSLLGPASTAATLTQTGAGQFSLTGATNPFIQFGGTSASFSAVKGVGTSIQIRKADDSGYADILANDITSNGSNGFNAANGAFFFWASRAAFSSPADGQVKVSNNAVSAGVLFDVTTDGTLALRNRAGTAATGNIDIGAKLTKYNNIATTGWGVPTIYGSGRATAITTSAVSVATYTVGAADGSFLISANVNITTFVAGTFNVTVAYTDETNTAQSLKLNFSSLAGTIGIALAAAGPFEGIPAHIRCKASTAITIATSGTFTSLTYNVEGYISQIG